MDNKLDAIRADIEAMRQNNEARMEVIRADTEAMRRARDPDVVESLRISIAANMEALRMDNRARQEHIATANKSFKSDFRKWFIGAFIVQGAIVVALVKLL